MSVDPFIFLGGQTDLDLLKIHQIIDLPEIRKSFLRPHAQGVDVILARLPDKAGLGLALHDRLLRAAEGAVIEV